MPARRKVYGIWNPAEQNWCRDGSGRVFAFEHPYVAQAQLQSMRCAKWQDAEVDEVRQIGVDGLPVEEHDEG